MWDQPSPEAGTQGASLLAQQSGHTGAARPRKQSQGKSWAHPFLHRATELPEHLSHTGNITQRGSALLHPPGSSIHPSPGTAHPQTPHESPPSLEAQVCLGRPRLLPNAKEIFYVLFFPNMTQD